MADRPTQPESSTSGAASTWPLTLNYPDANVRRPESSWWVAFCFLLLVTFLFVTTNPIVPLWKWQVDPDLNPGLLEAQAWDRGERHLDRRVRYTALADDGKVYNAYPPFFTFASYAALQLGRLQGVPSGVFYAPWYVLLVALPLPIAAFWAFQQVLRRAEWSAVLTIYLLLGTPLLPVVKDSDDGLINSAQSVVSTWGLLLIAGDLLGRRRIWPAVIGWVVAAWSRQMTLLFAFPILWAAWRGRRVRPAGPLIAAGGAALCVGAMLAMNWMRFGSPFESGYMMMFRTDYAQDWSSRRAAEHGLFSWQFFPFNAWYMNLEPPRFRTSPRFVQAECSTFGVSIWMASPLLLALAADLRRWVRDSAAGVLMLASLAIYLAVQCYHANSAPQVGFTRYGLDFMPVWLVMLAPWCVSSPRARVMTLLCLAWSAWYYHMIV